MANLGDMFPRNFVEAFAQNRELTCGDVLYLHCPFTTPPKEKFLLVACCNPLLVLVINSEINPFIQAREELLTCQVELPEHDHDFLEWDSFVNCIEAHAAFNIEDIRETVISDYQRTIRGRIADYCMREVFLAVQASPTMKRGQKRQILEALDEYQ